jgi:hypothetical protein
MSGSGQGLVQDKNAIVRHTFLSGTIMRGYMVLIIAEVLLAHRCLVVNNGQARKATKEGMQT